MNPILRGVVSLVVAGGLAAGSALFATDWLHDRRAAQVAAQAAQLDPAKRVDRVVNALHGTADDGVYVAPDARRMLDAKGERAVALAIKRSATPVRVVVWSQTSHAGASRFDLVQQLESGFGDEGESGVYLVWEGPEDGNVDTYGPVSGHISIMPLDEFVGDPAATIPRLVKKVDDEVRWDEPDDQGSDDMGVGGGMAAGAMLGLVALGGIALLYQIFAATTKRRLPGTWRW